MLSRGVQNPQGDETMIRPRRSLLFMPGSNARALEKARNLPADGIILDLEDSVAPDAKAIARDQIAAAVAAGRGRQRGGAVPGECPGSPRGVDLRPPCRHGSAGPPHRSENFPRRRVYSPPR